MTLNTYVYIEADIDRQEMFKKCNELIGADESAEWEEKHAYGQEWVLWNSPGQGLPAWLAIYFRPDDWLVSCEDARDCNDYCQEDCDGTEHDPPCSMKVSFDTAYGYNGPNGEGCGQLHAQLVAKLGAWLSDQGITWKWRNEFTGEIHAEYDNLRYLYRSYGDDDK